MAESVTTGLTPDQVRAADIAADEALRQGWADRFANQGPTFDADLREANPVFVRWYLDQDKDVRAALRVYWAAEAAQHPDINHNHERGGYARLVMLIAYAAERFRYQA